MMLISSAQAQTISTQLGTATNTVTSAVSSAAQQAAANPYGLAAIWSQGDWIAKLCLLLLVVMSIASWAVIVRKFLELRRTEEHARQAHAAFDNITTVGDNLAKLSTDNPLKFVYQSGIDAMRQYAALKPRVDYDTWLIRAIESALSRVQTRMQEGLALLATIGSTAPFVGLFGTVWAIYSALVKIGASGQASIDRVAGPVGEALIMTAIGLAVAVPAVFGYNWLLRKNKLALESMRSFGSKLHIVLLATENQIIQKHEEK
jgi:biopolymer transport protein ExbB